MTAYADATYANATCANVNRAQATPRSGMRAYSSGRRAYRIVFRTAAVVFVAVALADRLNPRRARVARRSILAEARARAAATVPFIFMG